MAMVYKGKDTLLNRFIAIKILRDEFTTDQEFIKRFQVEAQAAASITHQNIVSVYDVGNEENLYYIVMELIQGKTLKEIIVEEEGPLPWKWSINIAIQIAIALDTAHKNNIVHRDIKPHNIIITEDGVAKVTDFGIAKAVSNSTITAFGATIGSVHYFSPEHARGGFTDSKSDLYSLGVVLYEMLTGRVPFDADTPVSIALKHMQEEPEEPKKLNEKIPKAVNEIILKAMRKDPNTRYQDAMSMVKDLNMALENPNGNFVDKEIDSEDLPTQKLSIKEIKEQEQKSSKTKKEKKVITFFKKHKILTAVICFVLLFFISVGGTITYSRMTNPKEVKMPNLVGISKEEAIKIIDENGLKLEVLSEEYNSNYVLGTIISQEPQYSEINIKMGTTIKVVVSKGKEETTIPKVIGMEKEEAIKAIEEAKLKAEIIEEESKKIEEGYIISQEQDAGTVVTAGDTLVIHVSKGVKKSQVVSVIGKDENEAKDALSSIGLDVKVSYDEDTSKNNGTVLKQSLDVGKEVEEGTSITITVNKLTETKSAILNINVKSLLGGKVEYEEVISHISNTTAQESSTENTTNSIDTQTTKKIKEVELKIMVGTDTVYKNKIDPTTTNLTQTITGKGTVTVKIFIDDIRKVEKDVNLNTTSNLTID